MAIPDKATSRRWPVEPGSGRGRSHGTSSSEPFDRWFRYPAGFASDYAALLLNALSLSSGTVLDCFAGSGVTGTAARTRGLDFIGIEAHPLVAELASLKLSPTAKADAVRSMAAEVTELVRRSPTHHGVDVGGETELVRRSFDDTVLKELVALRSSVKNHSEDAAAKYLKWALLATLRDVASVKVGWPYQRPGIERRPKYSNAIARFEARVAAIAADLESVEGSAASAQLYVGDSCNPEVWARIASPASACIASPPYLNNFDYADATRLELYFWGEVTSWSQMTSQVRGDMLTATTQQSSVPEKAAAVAALEAAGTPTSVEVLSLVDLITGAKAARGKRSKEYDQVAPAYFLAMGQILANLHEHLTTGATALWLVGDSAPYGVYVDTPRLIGQLAAEVGFQFSEDVTLRVRGDRWGTNSDRHNVGLTERLVVLTKT